MLAKTIKWNDGKGIAANAMAEMQDILSNDSSINKRVACTNMSPLFGRLLTQRAENEKLTASHAKERGKLTVDRALQMVMAEADAEAKELQGMVNVTEALQAAQQKKQSCKAVNHKQRMPIYETVCDNHNKCEYKITRYQDNYSTEQVCN